MVLAVVSSDSLKCPPIFIKNSEKVTADVYVRLLEENCCDTNYVCQQDGAPCLTASKTQAKGEHGKVLGQDNVAS